MFKNPKALELNYERCDECGYLISPIEYDDNDGLCDECLSEWEEEGYEEEEW